MALAHRLAGGVRDLLHYYQMAGEAHGGHGRNGIRACPPSKPFQGVHYGRNVWAISKSHGGHGHNSRPTAAERSVHASKVCVQGCKTAPNGRPVTPESQRQRRRNLDLRPEVALSAQHGAGGRTDGRSFIAIPPASKQRQKAASFCVAATPSRSALLLLLSESARYPNGSPNSASQVVAISAITTGCFALGRVDSRSILAARHQLAGVVWTKPGTIRSAVSAGRLYLEMAALDLPSLALAGLPQTLWGRELGFVMDQYRAWPESMSMVRICRAQP